MCAVTSLDPGVSSPKISWEQCSDVLIERANKGRDGGAYRDAIRYLLDVNYGGPIAIANDSVLWREDALSELVAKSKMVGAEIVGATSSLEPFPHIQTYWIWISAAVDAARLSHLSGMWRNVRTREAAISYSELRFAHAASQMGLTTGAIFPFETVVQELARAAAGERERASPDTSDRRHRILRDAGRGVFQNPTHAMWSELLTLGFPGIKRDLLRSNPEGVEDYFQIRPVAAGFGFDAADLPLQPASRRGFTERVRQRVIL